MLINFQKGLTRLVRHKGHHENQLEFEVIKNEKKNMSELYLRFL